jgi:hypothetical protein
MAAVSHVGALGRWDFQPTPQKAVRSFLGIVLDQPHVLGFDFRPDVYLIADENRPAGGQRLGHGDAKILLVRREDEGVRSAQRAPFGIARDHARPVDPGCYAQFFRDALERRLPANLIGAGHDQIQVRGQTGGAGEGPQEQVAALFLVQATQEQQVAAVP